MSENSWEMENMQHWPAYWNEIINRIALLFQWVESIWFATDGERILPGNEDFGKDRRWWFQQQSSYKKGELR